MKRTIAAFAGVLVVTGCASDTMRTIPDRPIQIAEFVDALNSASVAAGQSAVGKKRALDFATSLCDSLDAGMGSLDAMRYLADGGLSPDDADDVAVAGIAAVCPEHLPER